MEGQACVRHVTLANRRSCHICAKCELEVLKSKWDTVIFNSSAPTGMAAPP